MIQMQRQQTLREHAFVAVGSLCKMLPEFRGRVRLFLTLFRVLGLTHRHLTTQTTLTEPTKYVANLDLHSWLQRIAFLTGGYEGDTVRFLRRLQESRGHGYLLDIGANIGLISIPYALLTLTEESRPETNSVTAIAIEAVTDNFRALKINVALNDLDNHLSVYQVALGDTAKTVEIQVEGDLETGQGSGTANILPDGSTYECVRQTLELRKLDDLGLPSGCSVIKIDTDGYDLKVLQGSTDFLKSERPVIFGEFSAHCMAWHGQGIKNVLEFSAANDYLVLEKLQGMWKFSKALNLQSYVQDLLLVPDELLHYYVWCIDSKETTE